MTVDTKFKIAQDSKYLEEDWWRWWIYLDADDAALDEVEQVIYILHPTFSPPFVTVKSRENAFKFTTEGWGVFTIYATVHLKNGEVLKLEHELELYYPGGEQNFE